MTALFSSLLTSRYGRQGHGMICCDFVHDIACIDTIVMAAWEHTHTCVYYIAWKDELYPVIYKNDQVAHVMESRLCFMIDIREET